MPGGQPTAQRKRNLDKDLAVKNLRGWLCLLLGAVCMTSGWTQRLLTQPDFSGFSERNGGGQPLFRQQLPTPAGGLLVVGRFEVYYEGRTFRDAMLFDGAGFPDLSWAPELTSTRFPDQVGVTTAAVTPTGVFLAGNFDGVNGQPVSGVAYLSWSRASLLGSPVDVPNQSSPTSFERTGGILSNHEATANVVFFYSNKTLYRLSARTAEVEAVWRYSPFREPGTATKMLAEPTGGIWLEYLPSDPMPLFGSHPKMAQYRNRGNNVWEIAAESGTSPTSQGMRLAGEWLYFGARRFAFATGLRDSTWRLDFDSGDPQTVNDKYVYMWSMPLGVSTPGWQPRGVARAPIADGVMTSYRLPLPVGYARTTTFYEKSDGMLTWPINNADGDIAIVMQSTDTVRPISEQRPVFIVKDDGKVEPEVQVVEYYAPALKRYFITGRAGEQTALDGLPQSFQRTGMKFTAKSSKYRDIAEQPVCRMYASPEKGMSNSHFYGIGSDCATLNKLSGLKYEGYDFSILKPTAEQACPAEASKPVTRLFNNKVASNESNHRYVVSAATKAKMLSQGWVDEGVVFCASAVTDAGS